MDASEAEALLKREIDRLAAIEHERWAHWQRYMHGRGELKDDGSLVLPADLVRRWTRQIETPFSDLDEAGKESDREQVRHFIPTIADILTSS